MPPWSVNPTGEVHVIRRVPLGICGGDDMGDEPAFGRELRRRRQAGNLTLGELARRIHFSTSYLSRIERGERPAGRQLAVLCDQVLGAGGDLAALVSPGAMPRATRVAAGNPLRPGTSRVDGTRPDVISIAREGHPDQPLDRAGHDARRESLNVFYRTAEAS